jgi:hypothetical protein
MARSVVTFETVRKIALTRRGVESGSTYAADALKVKGKLVAWIPTGKGAEADSIAFRIDPEDRDELVAASPETYYVPAHYMNYETVLVRCAKVDPDDLPDLLNMAYKFVMRKGKRS